MGEGCGRCSLGVRSKNRSPETDQRPTGMTSRVGLAPKGGTLFSLSSPQVPFPRVLPLKVAPPLHTWDSLLLPVSKALDVRPNLERIKILRLPPGKLFAYEERPGPASSLSLPLPTRRDSPGNFPPHNPLMAFFRGQQASQVIEESAIIWGRPGILSTLLCARQITHYGWFCQSEEEELGVL